jgi:hypothetical protein
VIYSSIKMWIIVHEPHPRTRSFRRIQSLIDSCSRIHEIINDDEVLSSISKQSAKCTYVLYAALALRQNTHTGNEIKSLLSCDDVQCRQVTCLILVGRKVSSFLPRLMTKREDESMPKEINDSLITLHHIVSRNPTQPYLVRD